MARQVTISLRPRQRGFHIVSSEVAKEVQNLISEVPAGVLHLFIKHTSASLTINENADPDVLFDMEMATNRIAPENWPYTHTAEGPDDMPAHVKSSLYGSSLMIPITDGKMNLGTWQGIYLCEHRDRAGSRQIIATVL